MHSVAASVGVQEAQTDVSTDVPLIAPLITPLAAPPGGKYRPASRGALAPAGGVSRPPTRLNLGAVLLLLYHAGRRHAHSRRTNRLAGELTAEVTPPPVVGAGAHATTGAAQRGGGREVVEILRRALQVHLGIGGVDWLVGGVD